MASSNRASNATVAGRTIAPTHVVSQCPGIRSPTRNHARLHQPPVVVHHRVHAAQNRVFCDLATSVGTTMAVGIRASAMAFNRTVLLPLISPIRRFAIKNSCVTWANVLDRFAWPMGWSRVSALRGHRIRIRRLVSYAARSLVRIRNARARSCGTMCRSTYRICLRNLERRVMIIMGELYNNHFGFKYQVILQLNLII